MDYYIVSTSTPEEGYSAGNIIFKFTFNLHTVQFTFSEGVGYISVSLEKCMESQMYHNQDTEQVPHHRKLPHAAPFPVTSPRHH